MGKKLPSDLRLYLDSRSVKRDNGCIEWTGPLDKGGYGQCQIKNQDWRAHRLAYSIYNGISRDEMKGLLVCHQCDNASCINHEHLYLGTHTDNNRDTVKRFRRVSHTQKLSIEQVNEIRTLYGPDLLKRKRNGRAKKDEITYQSVGRLYGVYDTTIHSIMKDSNYRHSIKEER